MLKYIVLLLLVVSTCSAQLVRANYRAGNCATTIDSLFLVLQSSSQCLTGNVYPFNGETRLYSCSGDQVVYQNCSDTSCGVCSGNAVQVGTTTCIAWTTNDYSDQLSCGSTLPPTPVNTPLVSQFDGTSCTGGLQFTGIYGDDYCTANGLKYSCNSTTFVTYNCTSAGCGNCTILNQVGLASGSNFCSGYSQYQCLNSTSVNLPTGSASSTTGIVSSSTGVIAVSTTGSSAPTGNNASGSEDSGATGGNNPSGSSSGVSHSGAAALYIPMLLVLAVVCVVVL